MDECVGDLEGLLLDDLTSPETLYVFSAMKKITSTAAP